jgi:hypothetical protein
MGHVAESKHTALPHEGTAAPDCTRGTCNPANFTVLKPSDWTPGKVINRKTDKQGLDPESDIPQINNCYP